jgi:hypothetical protein
MQMYGCLPAPLFLLALHVVVVAVAVVVVVVVVVVVAGFVSSRGTAQVPEVVVRGNNRYDTFGGRSIYISTGNKQYLRGRP